MRKRLSPSISKFRSDMIANGKHSFRSSYWVDSPLQSTDFEPSSDDFSWHVYKSQFVLLSYIYPERTFSICEVATKSGLSCFVHHATIKQGRVHEVC